MSTMLMNTQSRYEQDAITIQLLEERPPLFKVKQFIKQNKKISYNFYYWELKKYLLKSSQIIIFLSL